jgi:hypothetical protein
MELAIWNVITCITTCPISTFKPINKSIVFNIFICIVILSHVNLKVENQWVLSLEPSPNYKPTKKKKKAKEWKINKIFQNV